MPGAASWYTALLPYGHSSDDATDATIARRHHVSPGGLTHLGIPLVAGRDFDRDDRPGHPAAVIVGESLAASLWPGEDALGRQLVRRNPPDPNEQQGC